MDIHVPVYIYNYNDYIYTDKGALISLEELASLAISPVCVLMINNNNTQIAAIALPPSTTHPQLWAELLTFKPKCTIA